MGKWVIPLRVFRFAPRLFTNDAFWRVSADTKTCGSPLYLAPAGGLCLPFGKHASILIYFQTMSTKKRIKKHFF